jgi:EAL domain-containing protein (putative c-di-GMP-specific phosphodiesterase class I)/GGDEF domain-containing protein
MPLQASALFNAPDGWTNGSDTGGEAINTFVDQSLAAGATGARQFADEDGNAIGLVRALPSLDGTRAVLLLRYPLSSALSPYRALFGTLFAIGVLALVLLIAGTWFLARGITQPLSTLEEAAKHLQQGVYDQVVVKTKDELSRLAESFNGMINTIRERERRITHLAYHDAETRLPNRLALERRLAGAPQPERLYLAAIGVDRFAHVRGAIGYALAGTLIQTLGARLARLVPNAPVGRLSSEVLGVAFLAGNEADARKRADAIVANLEESLSLEGQIVDVGVTIGLAQPRAKGETPAGMIERASIALDQARSAKHKVDVFDENAYGDPARNLSLMGEMRRALDAGHITLLHQPKYNYRAGRIEGAESLVRWRHPTRGMIPPDLFVPMAEETGHIRALTERVLQAAIEDQQRMSAAGWPLTLSVNISARLLSDTDFANVAIEHVRQAPHGICFEITETAVIDNPKVALENIELFAAGGVRVAIDDYGSGLSSLAYLKQLPARELKIDKMFIQNLTNSQRDALLVRSTIELAHGLGMEVTAEGVETPAAFALLASMRCDMAQGYLVSRPATVEELLAILNDERRMRFYQQTATSGANPAPPSEVPSKPRLA